MGSLFSQKGGSQEIELHSQEIELRSQETLGGIIGNTAH